MDWITLSFLDGLGTVGTWTLIGLCLIFDKGLALKREVTQRDKTIVWQRGTIEQKDATIFEFSKGANTSAEAFHKVSQAAVMAAEGGEVP